MGLPTLALAKNTHQSFQAILPESVKIEPVSERVHPSNIDNNLDTQKEPEELDSEPENNNLTSETTVQLSLDSNEVQPPDSYAETNVKVNGENIPVPQNGKTNRTITSKMEVF